MNTVRFVIVTLFMKSCMPVALLPLPVLIDITGQSCESAPHQTVIFTRSFSPRDHAWLQQQYGSVLSLQSLPLRGAGAYSADTAEIPEIVRTGVKG
jgi:hypothetical protein